MATDLSNLVKSIFKDKRNYADIEDDDKQRLFFIFNRYASRMYPDNANFFNKRGIDTATAMDIWFDFFRDSLYIPGWFYPVRAPKKQPEPFQLVLDAIPGLDRHDKDILKKYFSQLLKDKIESDNLRLSEDLQVIKLKKENKKRAK